MEVTNECVLQDLAQLPHGANTLVGDQGVMLSGVSQDAWGRDVSIDMLAYIRARRRV